MNDLTGLRLGRLTVEGVYRDYPHGRSYRCRCDCGAAVVASESRLRDRNMRRCAKSCPLGAGVATNRLRLSGLSWREIAATLGYGTGEIAARMACGTAYKYRKTHPDWEARVAESAAALAERGIAA